MSEIPNEVGEKSTKTKFKKSTKTRLNQNSQHWKKSYLIVQGIFYLAQGAAFAAIIMIPVYFQDYFGIPDDDAIFYQSIIMLPWYIKIIFGLVSDKFPIGKFGKRRPYILIAGVIGLIGWFGIAGFQEFSGWVVAAGILLAASVAIADTVFDSLGVDVTPPKYRSMMQGVGWGMRGFGGFLSGMTFGQVIQNISWSAGYYIFGSLMVIGCFATLFMKEPMDEQGYIIIEPVSLKMVGQEFRKNTTLLCLVFNIIGGAALAVVSVASTFLYETLGISLDNIGLSFSLFAIGQFAGALLAGFLGQKLNLKGVLLGSSLLYTGLILFFLTNPFTSLTNTYIIIVFLGAFNGGYETTEMRISMEFSVGKLSGTMYSFYNSMANLGQLALGSILITLIKNQTGSYIIGMQAAAGFILLTLIPGFRLIHLWKSNQFHPSGKS